MLAAPRTHAMTAQAPQACRPQARLPPPAAACGRPGPKRPCRRSVAAAASSSGFHQSLLVATERSGEPTEPLPAMAVREAEADAELQAAAWLRALSFYRYPEERKFAAQVHRTMVAEEEVKALKAMLLARKLDGHSSSGERSTCLVALCPAAELAGQGGAGSSGGGEPLDEQLVLDPSFLVASSSHDSGSSAGGMQERAAAAALAAAAAAGQPLAVVGTLDLYAVAALQGEVLIGDSRNAAYLANVCTAPQARRRGVGQALLAAARRLAVGWGVDALYVHTMAVNEIAVRFYERQGFVVEKEESSNQAHYRGRCLDGIEGRGRTVLMRDSRLHQG